MTSPRSSAEVDLTPLIALLAQLYPDVKPASRDPRPVGDDIREWMAKVPGATEREAS